MAPTRFSATENLRTTTPEPTSGDRATRTKPRTPTAACEDLCTPTSARSPSHGHLCQCRAVKAPIKPSNQMRRRAQTSCLESESAKPSANVPRPTSDPNVDPRAGIVAHEQPTAETRARTCTLEPMHPKARTRKAAPGEWT